MRAFVRIGLVSALALVASSTAPSAQAPPPPPAYQIVVRPSSPVTTLDRRFLEDAFLKKIKTWPNGEAIRPVALEPRSPVRRRFTEEVLRRPLEAVRAYWQQRIFSGRDVPPPELAGDEAVLRYVMKYPGAIGYVSRNAALNGAKAVSMN